jgi:hypothetical protein
MIDFMFELFFEFLHGYEIDAIRQLQREERNKKSGGNNCPVSSTTKIVLFFSLLAVTSRGQPYCLYEDAFGYFEARLWRLYIG